ncbi:MAG: cysteine desulfurase family protein [Acidimicrobiales bacterium]
MARHYLDHASTAPLRPEARAAMTDWDEHGVAADPGRVHTEGRMARVALEEARDQVAYLLGVQSRQVIFTSGGTEAVNAAVWGVQHDHPGPVALSMVEHSAVREASFRSGPVVAIAADQLGLIELDRVGDALERCRSEHGRLPALLHCQWGNHEVGTVHPVHAVVGHCRSRGVPVHVDAVAAVGHVPIDLTELGADLVSLSAHKFGGPAGIGALVLRRGFRIAPFVVGGDQERARRAGFEQVGLARGFGAAATVLARSATLDAERQLSWEWTERLAHSALAVDGVTRLGNPVERLPHILCLGIEGVEAEPVLVGLDQAGIAAHSGSSCSSESLEPSPVLATMGVDPERSLRLSVGWSTIQADIEAFEHAFPPVVQRLRSLGRSG